MLLTIDIGNTNITIGCYQAETLGKRWRLATDHERMADEYGIQLASLLGHGKIDIRDIQAVCLASVVPPLTGRLVQACKQYLNQSPFIVDSSVKTGINITLDDPSAIGADRLVDAAAVQVIYGGPACIVDFGTATTFDVLDNKGNYLGGAIAPGIGISADALFQRTSKLPRVDLVRPPSVIGKNTVHAMQSGLLFGYVSMVEGMVARIQKTTGDDLKVIGTGGLAEIVANETDVIQIVAPWLTLDGLRIIWEMNHKHD
ncbi:type III pantothenate kinase [Leptolinea tardivitalis]|uniref:Type III pantothenate kinase n=1 Tax=Leptolinea tardivitalis TaxID=229920 RepID=A0A0P6XBF8_9CHLR|nr:type III pantothenate kinase [Leptolinea tardivitalis]KPL72591.1 pantothenate kinase [Leptolinea tardivitalis]GAP21097.1 panthothenate kinase [Leptolinea tardivitalis]